MELICCAIKRSSTFFFHLPPGKYSFMNATPQTVIALLPPPPPLLPRLPPVESPFLLLGGGINMQGRGRWSLMMSLIRPTSEEHWEHPRTSRNEVDQLPCIDSDFFSVSVAATSPRYRSYLRRRNI